MSGPPAQLDEPSETTAETTVDYGTLGRGQPMLLLANHDSVSCESKTHPLLLFYMVVAMTCN